MAEGSLGEEAVKDESWEEPGFEEGWSTEGYWASYSDLMAGILLVFAVAAAGAFAQLTTKVLKPTEPLLKWKQFANRICQDEEFHRPGIVVDCETGTLIIRAKALHYKYDETVLPRDGEVLLVDIVPRYLDRVVEHVREVGIDLKGIEVSGHADSQTQSYAGNIEISSARAQAVLVFLEESPEMARHRDLLREKGYAVGYGDTRPPGGLPRRPGRWEEARRVEIQVHIDEISILKEMRAILDEVLRGVS